MSSRREGGWDGDPADFGGAAEHFGMADGTSEGTSSYRMRGKEHGPMVGGDRWRFLVVAEGAVTPRAGIEFQSWCERGVVVGYGSGRRG